MPPHPHPDAIADCVLNTFHTLQPNFKPRRLADGRKEWVPLAGIVLSRQGTYNSNRGNVSTTDNTILAAKMILPSLRTLPPPP